MSLENKTVLIAGVTGKLNLDISNLLLKDGVERLIFACQTKEHGEQILKQLPSTNRVSILSGFDLLDPKSIKTAIGTLPRNIKIDTIFLQASESIYGDTNLISWKGKKIEPSVFQNTVGVRLSYLALKRRNLLTKNARIIVVGREGNKGLPNHIEKPEYHPIEELHDYIGGKTRNFSTSMPLVFLNFSLPFGFWKWQPKQVQRNLFGLIPIPTLP